MEERLQFISASQMAKLLDVSVPHAYKLIRQMNEELDAKGFITISGKVPTRYFEEKFYGITCA